ncbi:hypothetical protein TIFTF001_045017 [Ficus carica]|uniref:Uncharacterized protein n=1 Tax=Ficus carica TaxID=3494 RepID=A0AA88A137_FICCA|nr:hypothetical protein TIFTF001_045015 [Ficus carica]GMN35431.1 hypothetical protein TIFTF001_045017 [Ficus carica]
MLKLMVVKREVEEAKTVVAVFVAGAIKLHSSNPRAPQSLIPPSAFRQPKLSRRQNLPPPPPPGLSSQSTSLVSVNISPPSVPSKPHVPLLVHSCWSLWPRPSVMGLVGVLPPLSPPL